MGVIGITQSLAHELAQWNITVNAFCPGIIESEMWDYNDRVWGEILSTDDKRYGKGELMAEWVEGIPMKVLANLKMSTAAFSPLTMRVISPVKPSTSTAA